MGFVLVLLPQPYCGGALLSPCWRCCKHSDAMSGAGCAAALSGRVQGQMQPMLCSWRCIVHAPAPALHELLWGSACKSVCPSVDDDVQKVKDRTVRCAVPAPRSSGISTSSAQPNYYKGRIRIAISTSYSVMQPPYEYILKHAVSCDKLQRRTAVAGFVGTSSSTAVLRYPYGTARYRILLL